MIFSVLTCFPHSVAYASAAPNDGLWLLQQTMNIRRGRGKAQSAEQVKTCFVLCGGVCALLCVCVFVENFERKIGNSMDWKNACYCLKVSVVKLQIFSAVSWGKVCKIINCLYTL